MIIETRYIDNNIVGTPGIIVGNHHNINDNSNQQQ